MYNVNVLSFLAVTLSGIASALTCIAFIWLPTKSIRRISVCGLIFTAASTYIIVLASQSPTPVLKGSKIGSALVVGILLKLFETSIFKLRKALKSEMNFMYIFL